MSGWGALTLTIAGASALIGVPLIPAVIELRRKSDAGALSVVQEHAGEIRHFAESFRSYVATIEPVMEQCRISGRSHVWAPRCCTAGSRSTAWAF